MEQYTNRGWVLLPIRKGEKKATHTWKALQTDPEAAQKSAEFFRQPRDLNVAVMTGQTSGVFVVDVDPHHMKQDPQVFVDSLLAHSPTSMIARTPRGGWHLYYRYPEGQFVGQSSGGLPEGVDVRGQGGYALVAPSVVHYEDGSSGTYTWDVFDEPGTASSQLLSLLRQPSANAEIMAADDLEEKLTRILSGDFTQGAHNNELFWAAGYLRSKGLPEGTIVSLLVDADSRDVTPQGAEQVKATCRSVFGHAAQKDSVLGPADGFLTSITHSQPEFSAPSSIMEMGRYIGQYSAETRYLIPGFLPMNSVIMLTAQAETGKTWLLMDMAVTIALGRKLDPYGFLGQHPSYHDEPRNVIIFQQEDQPGKISQRIEALYNSHVKRIGNPFKVRVVDGKFDMPTVWDLPGKIYIYPTADFSFEDPEAFVKLEAMVKEVNAAAVFFDPLYSLGNSQNYFAEFTTYFQELKHIRIRQNTTFLLAHHMRKSREGGRQDAYGSALLDAASEGQILMSKERRQGEKHPFVTLQISGKAFDAPQVMGGFLVINTDPLEAELSYHVVDEDMELFTSIGKQAFEIYTLLADSFEEMTEAQISKALGIHNTQVSRMVAGLVDAGKLECVNPDAQRKRKYIAIVDNTEAF